jgi:signal peptidase II
MGSTPNRLVRVLALVLLATGLFGCDHATKLAAKVALQGASAVPVVDLRYVENDDIAFSAFHQLGLARSRAALVGLGVAALVAIAVMAWKRRRRGEPTDRLTQVAMALFLGGALGNLVDRIVRGYVVDFIHVRGWPVFNVADIAVVVAFGLLVVSWLRQRRARTPSSGVT